MFVLSTNFFVTRLGNSYVTASCPVFAMSLTEPDFPLLGFYALSFGYTVSPLLPSCTDEAMKRERGR
jgi:hypothetical protein